MSIKVTSISKSYNVQEVLKNISFDCKKGEIIGFLGPNGAGKSTMMKILTGYIKPNAGEVFVDEIDVLKKPLEAQKSMGYLPEHNPLYKDLYVREYLQFQASIFNISTTLNETGKSEIEKCITKVGLTTEAHKKIHQLSKGYQQRVGLAAAILHNPSVLILDEPTTGLDVNQLVEIRALIKELGKEKTVLFSTHIMQEVEAVCDRVIIINKGEILVDKSLKELQNKSSQVISITFNTEVAADLFLQLPSLINTKNLDENTWQLTFKSEKDIRPIIFDFAQENNLKVLELTTKQQTLESLFREVTT